MCVLCGKYIFKCNLNYKLCETLYCLQNAVTMGNAGIVVCGCSVWYTTSFRNVTAPVSDPTNA